MSRPLPEPGPATSAGPTSENRVKQLFEKKSENGKIPLIIQAKDPGKTRLVELQFGEPTAQSKKEVRPAP